MKHFRFPLLVFLVAAVSAPAALGAKTTGSTVSKRGAAVPRGAAVSVEKLLAASGRYEKRPVIVEGIIDRACTKKGCWMQLASAKGSPSAVRVTFKDYAFFIPLDAEGMRARAHGVVKVKTLSRGEAEHLVGEGAKLERRSDGTAREISFVASGVELRK